MFNYHLLLTTHAPAAAHDSVFFKPPLKYYAATSAAGEKDNSGNVSMAIMSATIQDGTNEVPHSVQTSDEEDDDEVKDVQAAESTADFWQPWQQRATNSHPTSSQGQPDTNDAHGQGQNQTSNNAVSGLGNSIPSHTSISHSLCWPHLSPQQPGGGGGSTSSCLSSDVTTMHADELGGFVSALHFRPSVSGHGALYWPYGAAWSEHVLR